MIPYIAYIAGQDLFLGFDRIDVSPYCVRKEAAAVDAKIFAISLKSAVLGMNAMCNQEQPYIIFVYPQSMDYLKILDYVDECKKYDIAITRTFANTSALMLSYHQQIINEDKKVLIITADQGGYSVGFYEHGGGLIESFAQVFLKDEASILDWMTNYMHEEPEKYCITYNAKLDISVFAKEYKKPLQIDYIEEYQIIKGGTNLFNILWGKNHCDMVFLNSLNYSLGIQLQDRNYEVIERDTTIPCKRYILLTIADKEQSKINLYITKDSHKNIGLLTINPVYLQESQKCILEVTFEIDSYSNPSITVKDKVLNKTLIYTDIFNMPPCSKKLSEVERFLPVLYES